MATSTITHRFSISADESAAFARLSGDFNPLHLDSTLARRTQFGGTVVHGIHMLLKTLDAIADDLPRQHIVVTLSTTFSNPLRTGDALQIKAQHDTVTNKVRISGEFAESTAFTATLELSAAPMAPAPAIEDAPFAVAAPRVIDFPPIVAAAETSLRLHRATFTALFPRLELLIDAALTADLLATTRIVGMECPGLDSIYSAAKFKRRADGSMTAANTLQYGIAKLDDRFRMVRLAIKGNALEGHIEAFFRPQPVKQKRLAEIVAADKIDFSNGHALVIGGSRGLGELSAKIFLAGGGKVTLTYSKGRDEARRIADEALEIGRTCCIEQLDVSTLAKDNLPSWLRDGAFTHVFYFASPHITKNASAAWNQDLFDGYAMVYLQAFALLAETLASIAAAASREIRFFYPSSIFVDQPEKGFAEYAAAKSAGEELCRYFEHTYRVRFESPRLPRVRTDQTSGLRDAGMQDAFPVMQAALRKLQS